VADKELSPEIQRLSNKVAADPQSRVFVQLADEYLKCGLVEEAIGVLSDGILNHPTHVAARMMLGKIYLKTKQVEQAKDEFEAVAHIYPDSILSHKNLVHIYRELGELSKAMAACDTILVIDPKDHEAQLLLASIQQEISVMGDIHSLTSSSQETAVPPLSPDELVLLRGDDAELFAHHETSLIERGSNWVEQGTGYDHPSATASDNATAGHITRLQDWLASIQEKRKDEF